MARTQCSECDEEIEIPGRVRLGQKLACNHCGAQLEVVVTEPLEVEIASDDDDDLWDDEEDDLDDDDLEVDDLETDDLDEDELDELESDLEIDDEFDDDDIELDDEDDDDDFEDDEDIYDDNDRWS